MRSHIGTDVNTPGFVRSDLEKIGGIDTRTARTLESLPQSRDTLTNAINDQIDDTNAIEGEPLLLFDDPTDPILTNTRKLIGSDNVSAAVGASEVGLDLTDTGVTADTYGAPDKLIGQTVDSKGRVTAAEEFDLESGNVTETSNLFYTDERARLALSSGSGIDYNNTTGVVATTGYTGDIVVGAQTLHFTDGVLGSVT